MHFTTIAVALLAGLSEARRDHHYRLMAIDPPSGATCYRGNQKQHPVFGSNAPPCWYQEPDNSYSCYEHDPKTNQCPKFPNKVNKPGSGNGPLTCYRGNMKQHPTSGPNAPPCWYKEKDGTHSCFEYDPITKQCPFPNHITKPTFHLRADHKQNHRGQLHRSNLRNHNSNLRAHHNYQEYDPSNITCLRGNQKNQEVSLLEAPPCIFMEEGYLSCYEFLPGTTECPPFGETVPNPKPRNSFKLLAKAEAVATKEWCYYINSLNFDDGKKFVGKSDDIPQCWYQVEGTDEYYCTEDVDYDGTCYQPGYFRPPTVSNVL